MLQGVQLRQGFHRTFELRGTRKESGKIVFKNDSDISINRFKHYVSCVIKLIFLNLIYISITAKETFIFKRSLTFHVSNTLRVATPLSGPLDQTVTLAVLARLGVAHPDPSFCRGVGETGPRYEAVAA
jgi:hypothetical protein